MYTAPPPLKPLPPLPPPEPERRRGIDMVRPTEGDGALGLGLELELSVDDNDYGPETPESGTDDENSEDDDEPPSPIDPFRPSFPRPPTPTPRPPSPSYSHLAVSPIAPLPQEPWTTSSVLEAISPFPHPFRQPLAFPPSPGKGALPTSSLPPRRSSLLPPWPTSYSSVDLASPPRQLTLSQSSLDLHSPPSPPRKLTLSHSSFDLHSPPRRLTLSHSSLDLESPSTRLPLDLDSPPKRLTLSLDALRNEGPSNGTDLAMVDHAPLSAVPSSCPSPVPDLSDLDLPTRPDYKWQSHSCAPCTFRPLSGGSSSIPLLVQRLVSLVLMPIAIPLLACLFWYCSWNEKRGLPKWIDFGLRGRRRDARDDATNKDDDDGHDNDRDSNEHDSDDEDDNVEDNANDEDEDDNDNECDDDDDDSPEEATVVRHWWRESLCSAAMTRDGSWDGSCSSYSGTPTPPLVKRTEDGLLDW